MKSGKLCARQIIFVNIIVKRKQRVSDVTFAFHRNCDEEPARHASDDEMSSRARPDRFQFFNQRVKSITFHSKPSGAPAGSPTNRLPKDLHNAVRADLNQRWPRKFPVSIDLISSFVVGINGGEILSARKPISSSVGMTSSRPAISPQIVTGFPEASPMMMPSSRSMDGWVSW